MFDYLDGIIVSYDELKAKYKKRLYEVVYFNRFLEKYVTRFLWKHKDLTYDNIARIETILIKNGIVGIDYKDNKFIIYDGNLSGEPDSDGVGTRFVGATLNGQSIDVNRNEIVVIYNNKLRLPDVQYIMMKSEFMKECEVSENTLIINSRATKIPMLNTTTEKTIVEDAMRKNLDGETTAIVSPLSNLNDEGNLQYLDLTNPELIRTMECITAYKQNVLQEICAEMGISISGKDKQAQMNESELKPLSQYAMITLSDNLDCRKKGCEDLKKLFGIEVTCELNKFFDDENADDMQDAIDPTEDAIDPTEEQNREDGETND